MSRTSKSNFVVAFIAVVVAGGSVAYKLTRTEPNLLALTGDKLTQTGVFKPCDVKSGSLSITVKSNEEVIINGVASKVLSFGKYDNSDNSLMTSCAGKIVSNISVVETGTYQFNISRDSNVLLISNLKNKLTDEILPGTWTLQ